MKRFIITAVALVLGFGFVAQAQDKTQKAEYVFTTVKENPVTSINTVPGHVGAIPHFLL